jgi:hypothetical protein
VHAVRPKACGHVHGRHVQVRHLDAVHDGHALLRRNLCLRFDVVPVRVLLRGGVLWVVDDRLRVGWGYLRIVRFEQHGHLQRRRVHLWNDGRALPQPASLRWRGLCLRLHFVYRVLRLRGMRNTAVDCRLRIGRRQLHFVRPNHGG